MTGYLIAFLILTLSIPAMAADTCVWHEGTGTSFADDITPVEAQRLALAKARYSAMEQGAGVSISGSTLVSNSIVVSDIVTSMSEGFIQKEKEPVWENALHSPAPGRPAVPSYTVKLKACVISDSRDKDGFFTMNLATDKPVYQVGEDISMTIRPGKDAYIGIFHIDEKQNVTMLLPGMQEKSIRLEAAKDATFPPEGLGLRAKLSPGKGCEVETFLAVATRESFDYAGMFGKNGKITLTKLFTALRAIPASKRAIAMAPFEIRGQ